MAQAVIVVGEIDRERAADDRLNTRADQSCRKIPAPRTCCRYRSARAPAAGSLLIVEPLKLIALVIAGEGHWLTGTAVLVAAYAVSILIVERLFRLLKPNLMRLRWLNVPGAGGKVCGQEH